jgi:hypothetical protein
VVLLITLLIVSPEAVGCFIAPCQQEAVTEQTSSSLSLTAVRAITERVDLKEDHRRSRRHFSLGKACLHLKGISTLRQCKNRL